MAIQIQLTPGEVATNTSLNARLDPSFLRETLWPQLVKDDRFTDIAHVVLEHASVIEPGSDPEVVKRYETFIEAAALVAHSLLSSGSYEIQEPIAGQS